MSNPLNPKTTLAQAINECSQRSTDPGLAHSNGEPDASSTKIHISVRFAMPFSWEIPILVADPFL
jgi:hypothetical protein